MKKNILLFFLSLNFLAGSLHAQDPMALPNGSFEQWTSHPGYSVTVIFMPISVFDTFSTPNSWNYPSYPVNQTVSLMGMNININTSIPIVKATRDAGIVPDGNMAVKLQTIMLEDIINPTVLSLAGDFLDSSLTQQAIPSILSTGEVDINAFIPLISDLMSGSGDIVSMLPTLLAMDVNEYITGGLSLGDFKPGRLTGSYKYHSAIGGDNGGVVMLGTHYNNTTHKREVVGGGINLALIDTSEYTPFEVEYQPLGALMPGMMSPAPDSLIVVLFSSANANMQQGSYLCLDDLVLWPAPDTCASVIDLRLENPAYDAFPMTVLEWYSYSMPDHWEVEYGPSGFQHGNGTLVETNTPSFAIYELENALILSPNTWYDFYVRSVCSDSTYSDWDSVHYRTFCAKVTSPAVDSNNIQVTANNLIDGYSISWTDNTETSHWGLYYGIYSQQFPDNWGTYAEVDTPYFEFPPLYPGKTYSIEITAKCSEDNYGDIVWVNFKTLTLSEINAIEDSKATVFPNPTNGILNIEAEGIQRVDVYDIMGRLVISASDSKIDLSGQTTGIYTLRITTDRGTTTKRIELQ